MWSLFGVTSTAYDVVDAAAEGYFTESGEFVYYTQEEIDQYYAQVALTQQTYDTALEVMEAAAPPAPYEPSPLTPSLAGPGGYSA